MLEEPVKFIASEHNLIAALSDPNADAVSVPLQECGRFVLVTD
jgi:hypothetical protein